MDKLINFTILYISLFVIETVGCFLIVLFYFIFESLDFKGSFDTAILWNLWRLMFYGLPFIALYFLFFKHFGSIKVCKPLLFSIFNIFVYVLLSVLSRIIWGKNIPLPAEGIMFWTACASIFLAPIVLGFIPYFRGLMNKI
jgi:hypothetical protein